MNTDDANYETDLNSILQPKQIKMKSFKNIIELGQFGGELFMHGAESVSENVYQTFQKYDKTVKKATGNFGLPSSTLQTFLKNPPNEKISGNSAYLGNFNENYTSKYYNSMFDDFDTLGFSDVFCNSTGNANEAKYFDAVFFGRTHFCTTNLGIW